MCMTSRNACSKRKDTPAHQCKGGYMCDKCSIINQEYIKKCTNPYSNESFQTCKDCRPCTECALNIEKSNGLSQNISEICCVKLIPKIKDKQTVISCTMLKNEKGELLYNLADDITKAIICDHLDKFGQLFNDGRFRVIPPSDYKRRAKYVRRDAPVQRTSQHPAGRKQECITCPIRRCEDRTGMCKCMCQTCFGVAKDCKCCKVCCKKCGNKEGECICTILEFLSLWSL